MEVTLTNPWVPVEWIAAHGFRTRGIWSVADEAPAPVAEGVCAFAQMARNQATRQGTPVIFTTACDQMRRAADEGGGEKSEVRNPNSERNPKSEIRGPKPEVRSSFAVEPCVNRENFGLRTSDLPSSSAGTAGPSNFLFNLPATWQTPAARQLYRAEVMRLGKFLQRLGGRAPTAADLEAAMLKHDELRAKLSRLVEQSSAHVAAEAMTGFFNLSGTSNLSVGSPCRPACAGVPLALVGGPLCATQWGIFDTIESAGGRVVLNATEPGERCLLPPLSAVGAPASGPASSRHDEIRAGPETGAPATELDTLLTRLCDHYFDHIIDVFQRPNSRLYGWLGPRLAARGVRGIVLWVNVGCDLWRAEAASLREAFGLPVLVLDSPDVRGSNLRDLNRLAAFIESLHGAPASGPASLRLSENLAGPEAGAPRK